MDVYFLNAYNDLMDVISFSPELAPGGVRPGDYPGQVLRLPEADRQRGDPDPQQLDGIPLPDHDPDPGGQRRPADHERGKPGTDRFQHRLRVQQQGDHVQRDHPPDVQGAGQAQRALDLLAGRAGGAVLGFDRRLFPLHLAGQHRHLPERLHAGRRQHQRNRPGGDVLPLLRLLPLQRRRLHGEQPVARRRRLLHRLRRRDGYPRLPDGDQLSGLAAGARAICSPPTTARPGGGSSSNCCPA